MTVHVVLSNGSDKGVGRTVSYGTVSVKVAKIRFFHCLAVVDLSSPFVLSSPWWWASSRCATMMAKAAARGRALRDGQAAPSPRQRRTGREDGTVGKDFARGLDRAYVRLQPAKCNMLSPRLSPRLSVSGWTSPRNTLFQTVAAAREELDQAAADDLASWEAQMQNPPPINDRTTRFAPIPAPVPRAIATCSYCECCRFPEECALREATDIALPYKARFARLTFPDGALGGTAVSGRTSPRPLPSPTSSLIESFHQMSSRQLRELHKAEESHRSRLIWDEFPLAPLPYREPNVYWP